MKKHLTQAAAIAAIALAVSPAWAINKCTQADGSVAFQDAPCAGGKGEAIVVRPASGHSPANTAAPAAAEGGTKPRSIAQRIEDKVALSQRARFLKDLELRTVPNAEEAVVQQRQQCAREMKELQARKGLANNNLAGATWEGAISGEMTALATTCDTRNRELREDAVKLKEECKSLGGCR